MLFEDGKVIGLGMLIIKDGKILLGHRVDGQGWSAPGGKLEEGETHLQGAAREANEEFGIIIPQNRIRFIGKAECRVKVGARFRPTIGYTFVTDSFIGKPLPLLSEVTEIKWFDLNNLTNIHVFLSTRKSLEVLYTARESLQHFIKL